MDAEAVRAAAAAVLGLVLGGTFGLILHEAGHAAAAWSLGLEPRLISIGHGRILLRWRLGGLWFVMRALPLYGFAARLPDPMGRPVAQALVIAAGPAASLAMLAITCVVLFARSDRASIEEIEALIGIACAAGGQLIASLIPMTYRRKGDARRHPTDGLKLWRIARCGEIDGFRQRYASLLHLDLAPSAHAPEILYQLGRSDLSDEWARADAAAVLTRFLDGDELNAHERRFLIDRLGLDAYCSA